MTDRLDATGRAAPTAGHPRRIVSLVPSISETLAAVGVADRVVAVTDFCVRPPGAFTAAERVRGTKNPDVDRVIELEPDLVLANLEENRERDVTALRRAGIDVHVSFPRDVPGAATTIRTIAALVGEPDAGERIAGEIDDAYAAARARAPATPLRVLCPIWRGPWMVVGEGCYAAGLLETAGLVTRPRTGERYPDVDPDAFRGEVDAVLLPSEPYAFREEHLTEWEGWDVPVRLVDGALLTWHGPRTATALERFSTLAEELRARAG